MAGATTLADGSTLADHLIVSSAGTGGWHEGEPMDPRTAAALQRAGYPEHPHVAHQISRAALAQADLVVALDRGHQRTLRNRVGDPARLVLLRSFDRSFDRSVDRSAGAATGADADVADVADPYYGGDDGFDDCLETIALGCRGLVTGLAALWDGALSL